MQFKTDTSNHRSLDTDGLTSPTLPLVLAVGPVGPTGPTGPAGPAGPAWTAVTAYTAGDVVTAPDGSRISRNSSGTSRATFDSTEQALWTTIGAKAGTLENTALLASFAPKWKPTTAYTAGDVVQAPDGSIVKRLTSGTSGSSYTSANWQTVATVAGTQAQTELAAALGPGGTAGNIGTTQGDARYALAGIDSTQRLLAGLKLEQTDQSILFLGDSTGNETTEWIYLLCVALAAQWPTWTVQYRLWDDVTAHDYAAAVTIQTGSGARTLTIYNASTPGFSTYSWQAARWALAVAALSPALAVISLGHNEGTNVDTWHGQYVALTEELAASLPGADILLIGQNPESANTYQQQRWPVYREIAARRGFGFIDVGRAFLDTDPTLASLLADGIHPNATGSALWRDTVLPAFTRSPKTPPRSQPPSTLHQAGQDVLVNGSFQDFTAALPDNWDAAGGTTTAAKNVTNYESANGYSVDVTSVSSGDVLRQILPLNQCKGKWLTLTVRERVAAGQAATAGRIAIVDSTGSTVSLSGDTSTFGAFRYQVVSRFIPATATFVRVYLYGDSAGGSGKATYDWASCVAGKYPRIGANARRGATGATGSPAGLWARKTADETRLNNTRADDSELKVTPTINTTWRGTAVLAYGNAGSNTPDFKARFNIPAGARLLVAEQALASGSTSVAGSVAMEGLAAGVDSIAGAGFSGAKVVAIYHLTLVMGATAGDLQLQWAQNVTDGVNGTTLYADSSIHLLQVA